MKMFKTIFLSLVFSLIFNQLSFSNEESPNQVLLEQYTVEFLDNNDSQLKLSYDLINFHESTLSKIKNIKALTPMELDYFYGIIKRILKNDRERSYLEIKARVLSDLNLTSRFNQDFQTRRFTLIWAATEMIGHNIFKHVFSPIYRTGKLRRMVRSDSNDVGLRKRKVNQFIKKYHNKKRKKRLRNFLKKFYRNKDSIREILTDEFDIHLFEIILNNENRLKIRSESNFKINTAMIRFYLQALGDSISIGANRVFSELSGEFGNSIGRIRWRNGRLKRSKKAVALVKETLEPLDILVEKTPFILTDYFIPGHFGHIALYLGNESQLKKMNLWNHPIIIPYQEKIKKGKTILEATRDGVEISSIDNFINVDEVAILRTHKKHSSLLATNTNEIYRRAFLQVGKEYDFNFDVETSDEIVCSELIYQTYYFVDWEIEKTLGRWTISPDNIVKELFREDPKIELVLYLKGYLGKRYKKLSLRTLKRNVSN